MTNVDFVPSAIDAGGCVSNGWNLVKNNFGLYLGVGLVAMILAGCIPCISLFLVGPILAGVYYIVLRDMRGEPVEFGMLFKGFEKFVPLMVIGIIQSIPEIIGQIVRVTADVGRIGLTGTGNGRDLDFFQVDGGTALATGFVVVLVIVGLMLMLFAIVWRVLLFFAIPLALENDLGVMDALKLSARAATSNVGGMILLFILEFFVVLLGILALCVGIFVAVPVLYAANAFAYRQVFPLIEQRFNMSPPPPNTYSFGGGQYT